MYRPNLIKIAYQTIQQSKSIAGLAHKGLSTKIMETLSPDEERASTTPIEPQLLNKLRRSIANLEKLDWMEAEQGIYPISQLFNSPWLEWATRYPLIWLDLPSTWNRRKNGKTRDLPDETDPEIYPDYYLQNFHHQTDGYLSHHSAELYDLQVEILFNGTADAMRRRVLAPLKRGLNRFSDRKETQVKILDIATGTGRTLQQIKGSLPKAELIGIDLSMAYLHEASRSLNNKKGNLIQLLKANAEKLPFKNNCMQGSTCVYLLHEMPRKARRNVINECWRVLEPGGIFILADSIQIKDSPDFKEVIENFPKVFHEPYYQDYINDDIEQYLYSIGFNGISSESHFMTKVWTATKPI